MMKKNLHSARTRFHFPSLPDYAKRARNSETQQQSYSSSDAIRRGAEQSEEGHKMLYPLCTESMRQHRRDRQYRGTTEAFTLHVSSVLLSMR